MAASALRGLEPLSSPLDEQQLRALNHALTGLSPVQLAWVSGYLAGVGGPGATCRRQCPAGCVDAHRSLR
jgi:hypothetical protein